MNNNPIQKLIDIINDPNRPDWEKSALILDFTFGWNLRSLETIQTSRFDLLRALSELLKALHSGSAILQNNVNPLIEKCNPGDTLKLAMEEAQNTFKKSKTQILAFQNQIKNLDDIIKKNEKLNSEKEVLQERMESLRRLSQFDANDIEELRKQVSQIENNITDLKELESLEQQIETKLNHLLQLSTKSLELLKESTRQKLEESEKIHAEILEERNHQEESLQQQALATQTAQDDLNKAQERYRLAQEELDYLNIVLNKYVELDRQIAVAIDNPDAASAKQTLDRIESMLKSVDKILKQAIKANSSAKKIEKIAL